MTEAERKVFDVHTLAEHWGCGTDTVYTLIRGGELPHFKLGGKLIRIRADEVERYECRMNTASNDTETDSRSSGSRAQNATDTRLERLTVHRPTPQPEPSGKSAP